MKFTKQTPASQVIHIRQRLRQTKLLLKHITNQLTNLSPDKDEQTIKLKLRQCDELNKQRIMLERLLGRNGG